jgi:crotonobetainyl-CoA:carnitine CoA-transferase CaiB-like acyl-CoA transferase
LQRDGRVLKVIRPICAWRRSVGAVPSGEQTARVPAAPAPMLGQHTEEVLLDVLGLSAAEFGRLHDDGIVGGAARR